MRKECKTIKKHLNGYDRSAYDAHFKASPPEQCFKTGSCSTVGHEINTAGVTSISYLIYRKE